MYIYFDILISKQFKNATKLQKTIYIYIYIYINVEHVKLHYVY